jgi:hypothetical protein
MPPWQPPFMWGPFRQYNPIPSNFVTNSCNWNNIIQYFCYAQYVVMTGILL